MGFFTKKPDERTQMMLSQLAKEIAMAFEAPAVSLRLVFKEIDLDLGDKNVKKALRENIEGMLVSSGYSGLSTLERKQVLTKIDENIGTIGGDESYPYKVSAFLLITALQKYSLIMKARSEHYPKFAPLLEMARSLGIMVTMGLDNCFDDDIPVSLRQSFPNLPYF